MIARARHFIRRGADAYLRTLREATPNAKCYLWAVTLQGVAIGLVGTLFAIYLKSAGFSEALVGDVEGALAASAAVTCLLLPPLVAVVGYRTLLVAASVAFAVSRLAQVLPVSAAVLVALGLLYGVGDGIMRSVGVPFLSEHIGGRDRTLLFTVDFFLRVGSSVVGSLLGGLVPTLLVFLGVSEVASYQASIVLAAAIFGLAVVPALRVREQLVHVGHPWAGYMRSLKGFKSWNRLVRFAVPDGVLSLGAGLIMPFVALYLKEHVGATVAQVGFIQGAMAVAMAMAVLAAPLVARRFGPIGTVVLTEVLSLPFLVAIPLATSVAGVATLMWVRAMLMNMSWPMFNEATMDQLPAHDKPLISGWMSVAWSACWVIGSVAGGRIMEYSYTLPYFIAAAFYAGGAVLTWLLLGGGRYLGPQSERVPTADAVLDSSAS